MIQHIPPKGHHLSKVSAAILPQTHTIRTVGGIYGRLAGCCSGHLPICPQIQFPTFPCSFLYSKGMTPENHQGFLARYFVLGLANEKHRQIIGEWEGKRSQYSPLPHPVHEAKSSPANTTPTGLPLEPDSNR